jgi:hypothetical protein
MASTGWDMAFLIQVGLDAAANSLMLSEGKTSTLISISSNIYTPRLVWTAFAYWH